MKGKKESKAKDNIQPASQEGIAKMNQISTKADLKAFLTEVLDRLLKNESAAIFAMVAIKQVLTHDEVYALLEQDTKEIMQEIFVKLVQSGFHLRRPPLLFGEGETLIAK